MAVMAMTATYFQVSFNRQSMSDQSKEFRRQFQKYSAHRLKDPDDRVLRIHRDSDPEPVEFHAHLRLDVREVVGMLLPLLRGRGVPAEPELPRVLGGLLLHEVVDFPVVLDEALERVLHH